MLNIESGKEQPEENFVDRIERNINELGTMTASECVRNLLTESDVTSQDYAKLLFVNYVSSTERPDLIFTASAIKYGLFGLDQISPIAKGYLLRSVTRTRINYFTNIIDPDAQLARIEMAGIAPSDVRIEEIKKETVFLREKLVEFTETDR